MYSQKSSIFKRSPIIGPTPIGGFTLVVSPVMFPLQLDCCFFNFTIFTVFFNNTLLLAHSTKGYSIVVILLFLMKQSHFQQINFEECHLLALPNLTPYNSITCFLFYLFLGFQQAYFCLPSPFFFRKKQKSKTFSYRSLYPQETKPTTYPIS